MTVRRWDPLRDLFLLQERMDELFEESLTRGRESRASAWMPTADAWELDDAYVINLDVPDLEAATRFYVDAFGFRVGRRLGAAGTELLGASVPLYLLPKADASDAMPSGAARRTYARHWTPLHLDFVVADLDAALARAVKAGATLESPPSQHAYGRLALLSDPFGHGFCLLQFQGRGYDEL